MEDDIKFINKDGKEIAICYEDPSIISYFEGKKVGHIEFDYIEIDTGCRGYSNTVYRLLHMEVYEGYKRTGIASEMMKFAVKHNGLYFIRPEINAVGGSGKQCHEYYTDDGRNLIKYCIKTGILNEDIQNRFDEFLE